VVTTVEGEEGGEGEEEGGEEEEVGGEEVEVGEMRMAVVTVDMGEEEEEGEGGIRPQIRCCL